MKAPNISSGGFEPSRCRPGDTHKQASVNVKHNIVANFVGRAWAALIGLIFLPLYLRFLGIEAYGLIGFYVSLMALFTVLDMGLSTTLNREVARLSVFPEAARETRDLVRTFEVIYWVIGIGIGGSIAIAAPFISRHWLNGKGIPVHTIEDALMVMGLVIALVWPTSLYSGGLMGLQRQVLLNGIRIATSTFQAGGAVLVLWLISPTILVYFLWQAFVGIVQTCVMAESLWKTLPASESPAVFRKELLVKNWRFAGGIAGITILVAILTQADKIALSKMLPLELFGYYALATVVAGVLNYVSNPVFSALFPRFTQVASAGGETEMADLYHNSSQLMAFLVCPIWIIVALFSREILTLWIGNGETTTHTHMLVSLLITGTVLNAIMFLPYTLQLAYGWTRLILLTNVVSVALFVPLLLWLISIFGVTGAALAWIALNAGYFIFQVPLMHRQLLKDSMRRWYVLDVGVPILICGAVGGLARAVMPANMPPFLILLWMLLALALAFACVGMALPRVRNQLRSLISQQARARAVK